MKESPATSIVLRLASEPPRFGLQCGAFDKSWHEQAIAMLNGPQIKAGHSNSRFDNTGLYFCETATVSNVEATLKGLKQS